MAKKRFHVNIDPKVFEILKTEFSAAPELDYRTYKKLLAGVADDGEEKTIAFGVDSLVDNITMMLIDDEERQRFREFINDPKVAIPVGVLADIVNWLYVEYKIKGDSEEPKSGEEHSAS